MSKLREFSWVLRDLAALIAPEDSLPAPTGGIAGLDFRTCPVDATGAALGTSGNPLRTDPTNATAGSVQLAAGTANAANVGGITTVVTSILTRPADQTPYTIGDEIADVATTIRTLTGAATKSGGSGVIQGIGLAQSSGTAATGLELWLFDTTSTPQADNAAFAPSDAVVATGISVISLTTSYQGITGAAGNVFYDTGAISIPFLCVGSANLYWRLVTRAAYTAGANSDTYTARFRILQDL